MKGVILLACLLVVESVSPLVKKPNFLYILSDDHGYNDAGFKNPDVVTPNIDRFAREGVILINNYVQPVCTPSRFALMTGRYPFTSAMQHLVIQPGQRHCSPIQYPFLPQHLKKLGYNTHIAGKWHLGHCRLECTPLYRGFDTFRGGYFSQQTYWTHEHASLYDWHNQGTVDFSANGTHSQDLIQARALEVLDEADGDTPFFLYLPFHNAHSVMEPKPEFLSLYNNLTATDVRKGYLGLVSGMDSVIGQVMQKLNETGLADNTYVMFVSDNGADVYEGDNSPLRGAKASLWEGGSKSLSFVWSPLLDKTAYENNGLMHVVDWLPTIVSLAGGTPPKDGIDGIDQSEMITKGDPSNRKSMVYNINREYAVGDQAFGEIAVRNEKYKLIWGMPGQNDGYGLDNVTFIPYIDYYKNYVKNEGRRRKKRGGPYTYPDNETNILNKFMELVRVDDDKLSSGTGYMHLFNLEVDPLETNNLRDSCSKEDQDALRELVKMVQYEVEYHYVGNTNVSQTFDHVNSNPNGYVQPGWCNDTVHLVYPVYPKSQEGWNLERYKEEYEKLKKELDDYKDNPSLISWKEAETALFLLLAVVVVLLLLFTIVLINYCAEKGKNKQ